VVEQRERQTRAVEDYLKAIYGLDERGIPVTTTALANQLGVTPPSVSSMLTRLRSSGFVSHKPYSEVVLTESGLRIALGVVRRRRLIESFLIESLGYGWDEIEHEAEVLEHAASERFVDRISEKLGHPTADPHGDPIPTREGELLVSPSHVLATLDPGATGKLARVWNGDPEVLRYLDSCGIAIGDRIEVLGREPFGGSMMVRVGEPKEGRVHGFGYGLAEVLSVELDR
jgi:DtxR family Mn-dependent transcriptional regulator